MTPVHFYHMFVGHRLPSRWEEVAEEHFAALKEADFSGWVYIGIVGSPDNRERAQAWLHEVWPNHTLQATNDEGFEQVTLAALGGWAKWQHPDLPILYAHTKGSFESWEGNHSWRRGMTEALVTNWRECVKALEVHDLAGYHWATPQEFPKLGGCMMTGNFWWARAGYLAGLPPVAGGDPHRGYNRYAAEAWLGEGTPSSVCQIGRGYPDCYPACCNGTLF